MSELDANDALRGEGASQWQAVAAPVRILTVSMTVQCEHCSQPVPINGPARAVTCPNCQKDFALPSLPEELVLASQGMRQLGSPYGVRWFDEPTPRCRKCEQVVPIAEWVAQQGATTTIACPGCATGLPTYPAPDWLRERLPAVVQVFGGDLEVAAAAGLTVAIEQSSSRPIAMACPQCAGGLLISSADDRVIECKYCSTSVFLPDELWRRLHPAKTMIAWTVTYTGRKLMSADDLAEQAAQRAQDAVEAAARARATAQEREARAREQSALQAAEAANKRGQWKWILLFVALLIVAFIPEFAC